MSIHEKLILVEKSQKLLLEEMQRLRQEVKALEEENHRLHLLVSGLGNDSCSQTGMHGSEAPYTARENLERLYMEGFHVCHLFFGRDRDGECLFCKGFLSD